MKKPKLVKRPKKQKYKPKPYEERLVELDKRTDADDRVECWWD